MAGNWPRMTCPIVRTPDHIICYGNPTLSTDMIWDSKQLKIVEASHVDIYEF